MTFFPKVRQAGIAILLSVATLAGARANPSLVVDIDSGDVLYQDQATVPWYPASTTKLMTVYVALSAVREGRITLDTPLMVSARAASMPPSKMGFRPGTLVTLGNALKMLMVKSPNDIAVTIAEGVSGSVEAFANDMNVYGTRLGLHESHFVNPNGLPNDEHMSSARDMGIITRALLHDFPEEKPLFGIQMMAFGSKLIHNHNGMLGRYPGVFGMKTGFTCAAGFNIVTAAEENGRRLAVIIMGAPSTGERDLRAAVLLDKYLPNGGASEGTLDSLPASGVLTPPDNHDIACGHGRRVAIEEGEQADGTFANGGTPMAAGSRVVTRMAPEKAAFVPVRVFIGPVPGWSGRIAQAVGANAKEYMAAPAPTVAPAADPVTADRTPQDPASTGAVEGATAPTPLALVGGIQSAPAAVATRRFVRSTRTLSMAAPARHKREARVVVPKKTKAATVIPPKKPVIKAAKPAKAVAAKAKVAAAAPARKKTAKR